VASEGGTTPSDPRPDRTGRDVEYRRDLRVVEAGEITQDDRRAELLGEQLERLVDVDLVGDLVRHLRGSAARDLLDVGQSRIRAARSPA
jgi:hypothetical protein